MRPLSLVEVNQAILAWSLVLNLTEKSVRVLVGIFLIQIFTFRMQSKGTGFSINASKIYRHVVASGLQNGVSV
jgi:hypothetical protein